jgi:endogenous inhibitor of DNA gyrase (YacG/DUF329 family)
VDLGSWLNSEYKIVSKTPEKANNDDAAGNRHKNFLPPNKNLD